MTPAPENPWISALRSIRSLLARRSAQWAVFGAVAANVYRSAPRTTLDVDLLVSISAHDMRLAAQDAESEGWEPRFLHPDGSMLRIVHRDFGPADLVCVEMEYQQHALDRACPHEVAEGLSVRVLRVEDVIIHKLIAGRFQDDADVLAILESEPSLDQRYLDHWIDQWEVVERYKTIKAAVSQRCLRH